MGRFAGWVNAYNAVFASVIDLPVAVVLAVDYLTALLRTDGATLPWYADLLVKASVVALVAWFNLRGLEVVEVVSAVLGVAVLLPFVAMLVVSCADGTITQSACAWVQGRTSSKHARILAAVAFDAPPPLTLTGARTVTFSCGAPWATTTWGRLRRRCAQPRAGDFVHACMS